jgi:hypothetical protein
VTLIDGSGDTTTSLNLAVPNGLSNGRLRMSMEFTNYADAENPVVSQVMADVSFKATAQATKTFEASKSRSEGIRFESSERYQEPGPSLQSCTVTLGAQMVLSPDTSSISGMAGSVRSKEKTVSSPREVAPLGAPRPVRPGPALPSGRGFSPRPGFQALQHHPAAAPDGLGGNAKHA